MHKEPIYQPRFYREWVYSDLINFSVRDKETDILVSAEKDFKKETEKFIHKYRSEIINYIKKVPDFKTSLTPLAMDKKAPDIIKSMLEAAIIANVGPMAAVAGAIAEFVGRDILKFTPQVILENGGDIFIKTDKERKIGIYAGTSPISGKMSLRIKPGDTPLGICTSSGTVGHSLSFGKADAVCIIARDAVLADACATATCNMVKTEKEIEEALRFAKSIEGVKGAVVIYGNKIGAKGDIDLE